MKVPCGVTAIIVLFLISAVPVSAVIVTFEEVILPTMTPLDGTSYYDPYGIGFDYGTFYAVDAERFSIDPYGVTNVPTGTGAINFFDSIQYVTFSWTTIWSQDIYADAWDIGGNLLGSYYAPVVPDQYGVSHGSGTIIADDISKLTWHDSMGTVAIEQIDFGNNIIPEPATLALLGLGFSLLGWRRMKQWRKK